MGRRSSIAKPDEVLQSLTRILRGDTEAKPAEILRACEMLGKHYGLFGGDPGGDPPETPHIVGASPAPE